MFSCSSCEKKNGVIWKVICDWRQFAFPNPLPHSFTGQFYGKVDMRQCSPIISDFPIFFPLFLLQTMEFCSAHGLNVLNGYVQLSRSEFFQPDYVIPLARSISIIEEKNRSLIGEVRLSHQNLFIPIHFFFFTLKFRLKLSHWMVSSTQKNTQKFEREKKWEYFGLYFETHDAMFCFPLPFFQTGG